MANTIYRGTDGVILVDTLSLAGKDGQSDMIIAPASGVTWQMQGARDFVENITTTRVVQKSDSGIILYSASGGTIQVNLPEGGTDDGIKITIVAGAATVMRVKPVTGEDIIYSGGVMSTGEYLDISAAGRLVLVSDGSGSWLSVLEVGTLTEETP
jgi:hypothetical protein